MNEHSTIWPNYYIQATIECGFTLKCVRGMTRTYSHPKNVIKQVLQQISEEHNKTTNDVDKSNTNINDDKIFSMNNESVTLEKRPLLVILSR